MARVVRPAAPKLLESLIGKSGGGSVLDSVAALLPVTYVVAEVAVWPILAEAAV